MDELISLPFDSTSNCLRFELRDATTNEPFSGTLSFASDSFVIVVYAGNSASPTTYDAQSSLIQTIATAGSYVAPASGKCRFRQVNNGMCELQLADSLFSEIDELQIAIDEDQIKTCWIRVSMTAGGGSELSRALAILSDSLPFRPDPSRTHIMRRANGAVGSNIVIPKKHSEIQEFYADVHALLGDNEFIGDVGDISITATTATVGSIGSLALGRTGKYIRYWLSGGTNGTTDTITIQFNSVDVDGNPIGDPTICTAFIKHIA